MKVSPLVETPAAEQLPLQSQNTSNTQMKLKDVNAQSSKLYTSQGAQCEQREFYVNDTMRNKQYKYESNYIRTTKYTAVSFVPGALLNQFKRLANCYFLLIAILQSIDVISPLSPFTAIAPFVIVISVSMLREGYEDYMRYKSDKETNSQKVTALRAGQWVEIKSADLAVGDVVLCKDEVLFPADLMLLTSSNDGGVAFNSTSSLDGEKNLKKKSPPKDIEKYVKQYKDPDRLIFVGKCTSEQPNAELYSYTGKINIAKQNFALTANQLLLKGAMLKNTQWCIGFVVFTGNDTRLMQNSQKGTFKMSKVEKVMNKIIINVLIAEFILSGIIIAIGAPWYSSNNSLHGYLSISSSVGYQALINYFSYFLLMNTLIPISLIISLEVGKIVLALFIMGDARMFSKERNRYAKVQMTTIIEELGQVSYIFSDKTGTLTRNVMEFKMCKIGIHLYGDYRDLEEGADYGGLKRKVTSTDKKAGIEFAFQSDDLDNCLKGLTEQSLNYQIKSQDGTDQINFQCQRDLVIEFMKCLSTAHECMPEITNNNGVMDIFYQGPSPDEITLVDFARQMGFEFQEASDTMVGIKYKQPYSIDDRAADQFKVYRKMEFNSDRKRMSILLKDPNDNKIKLYTKGADSIIKSRLDPNQIDAQIMNQADDFLNKASLKGFRTLLMAMKVVSENELKQFQQKCSEAEEDILSRETLLNDIYDQFERGLGLIGATCVEDRLQDKVPQTIADLQGARIKIWMLTGDKLETAENIGHSCHLLTHDMVITRCSDPESLAENLSDIKVKEYEKLNEDHIPKGIIVEASALRSIMKDTTYKRNFLKIAKLCEGVICCRVSPSQKADVVRLIKQDDEQAITLAIGDGANDVSMILEAHIGIGLYGNEGMRAVQSGDFALGQFKYLWRLLLIHGRWNYIRISELILYFFFKNVIFTLPQMMFPFVNAFSGQTIFEDWFISFYNLFFTSFPLGMKALFDQDINHHRDGVEYKEYYKKLYYLGQNNLIFNVKNYLKFSLHAALLSILCFLSGYLAQKQSIGHLDGRVNDMWGFSISIFNGIMIAVTLKLCIYEKVFTWLNVLTIVFLSLGFYFGYVLLIANFMDFSKTYLTIYEIFDFPTTYLVPLFIASFAFTIDLFLTSFFFNFYSSPTDYLRQCVSHKSSISKKENEHKFNQIYMKVKTQLVKDEIKKELNLSKKRDLIAQRAKTLS